MKYHSTRNKKLKYTSKEAIQQGLSPEGGLFVPESIPQVTQDELQKWIPMNYCQRAKRIFSLFLTDYSQEELESCVEEAYTSAKFSSPETAPVVPMDEGLHVLELWHGPTSAFKDMALQILPQFLTTAVRSSTDPKEIVILTATSGDTGKAAMVGFQDVPGTRIMVFYPRQGVSSMQKLQMATQEGNNVSVVAVNGNFDHAQTGVKEIFRNEELQENMDQSGFGFSSANSINWGRLAPQIVYYFSAYLDLLKQGRIELGQEINVVVPTGNFGNILAAWYSRKMGLPLGRLICASNDNKVLTDFIQTGVYDRRREFHQTISPSMDILISSNLERLLYELSGRDDVQVNDWMKQLSENGYYKLEGTALEELQSIFWGGFATEQQTRDAIYDTFKKSAYTMDPHTGVGKWVYDRYKEETGDKRVTLLVSTASPFKFPGDVLQALHGNGPKKNGTEEHVEGENRIEKSVLAGNNMTTDDLQILDELSKVSGMDIPKPLQNLGDQPVRHTDECEIDKMVEHVSVFIGL
ncbi:MAG: threonine synthase [Clostridiales bacterium]|nr:threonine synthase [Clostridiales bacterium]